MALPGFRSEADIDSVVGRFMDRTLPRAEWTHAAHFAVALWLLRHRGAGAMRDMPPLIRAFNEAVGVANTNTSGYHETITIASLRATQSWLMVRPGAPLHVVLGDMMGTSLGRSDWLFRHWSREVLLSPAARAAWVDPDLTPFPYPA